MGIQDVQGLWHTGAHAIRTPYGTILPPGGRVAAYLRSTGLANYDPPEVAENLHTTLQAALKTCRPGARDTIIVLPGHSQDVTDGTMLANLVEGTRIVGAGFHPYEFGNTTGANFRWTAAAANWAIATRGVIFQNLYLNFGDDSAAPVTKAITVTNLGCAFIGCRFMLGQDATQRSAIGLSIETQAHRTRIIDNLFHATSGVDVGSAIQLPDVAVDPQEVEIIGNHFNCGGAQQINVAGPNLLLRIMDNTMQNTLAGSQFCITFSAASSGIVARNLMSVLSNGTANALGISPGATTCRFFENYCSDESARSGVLSPVVVAT